MHTIVRSALPLLCSFMTAACGPSANPAPPARTPPTTAATPPAPLEPDLSPVSEPQGVVILLRARNLHETLNSAERMGRLPLSLENRIHELLREEGADIIDLDAGMDVVLALDPASSDDDPKFLGAFSIPVANLEQARAVFEGQGREVTPLVPGVYRTKVLDREEKDQLKEQPDGPLEFDLEEHAPKTTYCDLAASVGSAPARVVCSDRTEELDLLRPWLTRGLPTTPVADGDLVAEVRLGPLRDRYVPVARAQIPGLEFLAKRWLEGELGTRNPRLLALPGQLMEEGIAVLNDLDRLTFSASLDPNTSEMRFRGKIAFRDKSAWLTRAYTDANDEAAPAPSNFWRLPRDADSATYSRAADPKLYEGVHETVRMVTTELLTQTPLTAPTRSAIDAFFTSMPMHKAEVVSAHGIPPFDIGPLKNKKGTPTARDAVREVERITNSFGWQIIGVSAPAGDYADWIRKGVTMYDRVLREAKADPDIGKELRDAKWVPSIRVRNYLAGYPRGSMGVDVTVRFDSKDVWDFTAGVRDDSPEHPAGPVARGSVKLQLVVVPDGANYTWIGMATDAKVLKEKIAVVLNPAGRDATIASLPGLEPLRSTPTVAGGFVNYGGILNQTVESLRGSTEVDPKDIEKVVGSLPNRLQTPLLLLHTGTPGNTPVNELELRVQRGTVEDIAGLVQFAFSAEGRKLLEKFDAENPLP